MNRKLFLNLKFIFIFNKDRAQIIPTIKNLKFMNWNSIGKKVSLEVSKTNKEESILMVSPKLSEKNGTHVKETSMKVINLFEKSLLKFINFSKVRKKPCNIPQRIKLNVAPCQSAVNKNVIHRFL